MEAVHRITSKEVNKLHTTSPSAQYPITSYVVTNGITNTATSRSDTARDKIRRFEGVCSFLTIPTAMHTNELQFSTT
jgi:hypothetical protein